MKVHPLALMPLACASPSELSEMLSGRSVPTLWGRCTLSVGADEVVLLRLGDHSFDGNRLLRPRHDITDKMRRHLLGGLLDIYADIPLSGTCRITDVDDRYVHFACETDAPEYSAIPRHTDKSHAARRARQAAQVIKESSMHWMSRRLLDRIMAHGFPESITSKALDAVGYLGTTGNDLGDPAVKTAILPMDGIAPNIEGHGWSIMAGTLKVSLDLPESVVAALPGSPASRIIDHWLLDGIAIHNVRRSKERLVVTFEAPARAPGEKADRSRRMRELIEILRDREEKTLPKGRQAWDEHIGSIDAARTMHAEYGVLDSHMELTMGGKKRTPARNRRRK